MRLHSTLRRTLSLHFFLVAVLPALVFGLIAISLLHRHLKTGIYEHNRSLSLDIAASADRFLAEVETDLKAIAKNIEVMADNRPGETGNFLASVVYGSRRFESLYLLDAEHRLIGLGINPRVNLRQDDYPDVDFSKHEIFQQHPVIRRPVWSDSYLSPVSGEPSVTLAVPIKQGILLGNIRLSRLGQELSLNPSGSSGVCAIVDHNGILVASSDPSLAMQRVNFSMHRIIGRTLPAGGETVLESHDNLLMLESTAGVPRTGWVAWVGVDMDAIMAPVDSIRNLLIGVLALSLLLAAVVALVDAFRLMLPFSALSERAGQIGAGKYDFHFVPSGFLEIDRLAGSLEKMALAVREREQSILTSEQRFRELVNSIEGVVWEMDVTSGRYLFVSQQSALLFGFPVERWLEAPDFWASRIHPEDVERVVIRGRRSLALNDKHDLEYRMLANDGREVWVRDLVTVVWEKDEPKRLLGVMIDASARKQAEVELARYRLHLEDLVKQRTEELQAAQAELVMKERLAVLGQLTATVSHEIRNPLGTIANSFFLLREMLGRDCLDRVERPLFLAERSVQRCDSIISELLDFTRRRELQRQPVALDRWLAEMLEEMVWPTEVDCRWQFDCGITIQADPERLRRVMVNVINNAVQAMEARGGEAHRLEISTRRLADRCEIVVSDTGGGIPEEILPRIFEPLFSTKNFGVGLGVPIIRNIMEDHGGGVDYQSRAGVGTTVTLWFPL